MNAEVRAAAGGVIEAAVEMLQKGRAKAIAEQDQLVAQGNLAAAIDNARTYSNKTDLELSKCRTTLALSQQNKVGWFVNAITLGYNRRAQNACFAIMRELLQVMEAEQKFAGERVTELQSKQSSGSAAA